MSQFNNPELSVIVAVYNEDPRNLVLLLDRLEKNLSPLQIDYEVVFVNDGSRPPTSEALRRIAIEYDRIKLVELSRNFGQQAAITAGLDHSAGDAIVNMDSDLQDPPELIPEMLAKWQEGFDVVYAQRNKRRDRMTKRLTAYLFYRVLGSMSSVDIPWDTGDFRLMDRKVVDALSRLPEKTRFIRGMVPWLGFRQCGIPLDRDARELGESTYTIKKLLSLALDGILSFSAAPLLLLPASGLLLVAIGLVAFLLAAFAPSTAGQTVSIMAFVTLMTGVQILAVGIVAVYISRLLDEVRARPTYLVGERLGSGFLAKSTTIEQKDRLQKKNALNRDDRLQPELRSR